MISFGKPAGRIALLADIHGNLAALEAVARDMERRDVDLAANLGDSLSGPLLPLETARFLMARNWLHIAGNHERQLLQSGPEARNASDAYTHARLTDRELDWIASLQPTAQLEPGVFLCHGTPASDRDYFLETAEPSGLRSATEDEITLRLGDLSPSLVVCAHSHIPRLIQTRSGHVILNPGSVGLPAFEARTPFPHVVETGSPNARYAIVERTPAGWVVDLVSVPYDHDSMADLARKRLRPEWEQALRTGRLS